MYISCHRVKSLVFSDAVDKAQVMKHQYKYVVTSITVEKEVQINEWIVMRGEAGGGGGGVADTCSCSLIRQRN